MQFIMEPTETQKNSMDSRAKEIDTGAIPLPMGNVLLGLPYKPDPTSSIKLGGSTPSWTYADLVSQKKLIADIKIDINSTGKQWKFLNTWDNVLKTHFSSDLRKMFGLKAWTINFLFEVRSNFQQVGQLCIFYSNLPKVLETYHFSTTGNSDPFDDYAIMTQLPHRKIPMGEDQDVVVSLRWTSPHSFSFGEDMYAYDGIESGDGLITPYYDMGALRLYVPFPMQVATGVDSVMTVRVWSWLSDFDTGAYRPLDSIL